MIRYVDPIEGFGGYLAFAGHRHRLAAGGFRVQRGLDQETVARLAEAMERKERLLGLAVDGAKAGIDYDPRSPGKHDAMRRFFRFLRPHLAERLSLGPDMGTTWPEIECIARQVGVVSVKGAIAGAQGLTEGDLLARLRLLDEEVDGATLGERRAGHALAHAALAAAEAVVGPGGLRIGIQGFGTLARATAMSLAEAGHTPTAISDEHTCLHCYDDDIGADGRGSGPSTGLPPVPVDVQSPQRLFELPLDVLVLAACEDALSYERAEQLEVSAVVVGANLGLSTPVEDLLHRRGVLVVPDFVGGCGGSASMDALFGPTECPTPSQVLERVGARMRTLVARVIETAWGRAVSTRAAALAMSEREVPPGMPYGRWCRPEPSGERIRSGNGGRR
ncbi:MAG TPA: Glu/Leu/Phe/Val dehydrogenase dimerization domain-containing protein [Acidimicrobiales bacterium]|nr:Glu/Leu/Phe/Val dehydrogenase dimerization domain-containing protein [Acidimicrobiales bacterium]